MSFQYQLLPDLSQDEYQALKDDIQRRGVQVPVEYDEAGNLLDGHHRVKICKELNIKDYPSIIRAGMSEEEKVEHVLSLNLNRRHLTRDQRQDLVIRLRQNGWSTPRIAERLNISNATAWRDVTSSNEEVELPDRIIGNDGKSRPARKPSIMAKNNREANKAFEVLAELPSTKLPNHPTDTRRASRLAREHKAEQRGQEVEGDTAIGSCDLLLGDFRERGKEISDSSVDLIFTDPPYPEEYLHLWGDLSEFANRVLKPGGMLVAYTGAMYLPIIISELGKHLRYWWAGSIVLDGPHSRVYARNVAQGSKPLLFYVRHDFTPGEWMEDTYQSEGEQKSAHDWQQSLGCAEYYIQKLTKLSALVVDPFLGGGTTGLAALKTGRSFIGIEIERSAFALSQDRLNEWTKINAI